eukprot:COSAG03_NODE_871_length_5558_cov_34.833852_5_plen_34_part_00
MICVSFYAIEIRESRYDGCVEKPREASIGQLVS